MQKIGLKRVAMTAALALAAPAAAQNGSGDQGTTTTITSNPSRTGSLSQKAEPMPPTVPATTPSPATVTPPPATAAPAQPVVVTPPPQPVPQQPVAIQPDVAYPNGFQDPNDPFANDMALANRNRQGFPWGLLGLLGLLGLIPLFRGNGRVRTVYVERDDAPRRVVRERIEEE